GAASAVIGAMADKNDSVRRKATYALGRIAPEPATAISVLVKNFGDSNEEVKKAATEALSHFGEAPIPALIAALKDKSNVVRTQSVKTLGTIGSAAKDAIPDLHLMLFDKQQPVSAIAVTEALAKIGKDAIPTLTEGLKHESLELRKLSVN